MKFGYFALSILSGLGLASPSVAGTEETAKAPATTYVAKVDPSAFHRRPLEHKKLGVTVNPAVVRMITPGVDKFSIYNLIGAPHFSEGITRRWNYVLFFPAAPGSIERVRCRMEIRFIRERGRYSVTVSEVIWQEQSCADRVASAS
ncbi:outer membrane protein assembly factor BamE [Sphingomonas sp. DT-207]|uniref:outer membrane protein assembly factor BamE domain-containing protein n=1 Tax=Sphingomonas sp. DT-207 TaxID=3396167 RepID=UPI003F19F869